jgi:hypothetical protein
MNIICPPNTLRKCLQVLFNNVLIYIIFRTNINKVLVPIPVLNIDVGNWNVH